MTARSAVERKRDFILLLWRGDLPYRRNAAYFQRLLALSESFDVRVALAAEASICDELSGRLHTYEMPRWLGRGPLRPARDALYLAWAVLLALGLRFLLRRRCLVYTFHGAEALAGALLQALGFAWVADILDWPEEQAALSRHRARRASPTWAVRRLYLGILARRLRHAMLVPTVGWSLEQGIGKYLVSRCHVPPDRVLSLRNGVDEAMIEYGCGRADTPEFRVFYVGRIARQLGAEVMLEAIGRARRCIPGLQLTLAGPVQKGYADRLRRLLRRHGVGGHVRVLGPRSNAEVLAEMRRADVCLYPFLAAEGVSETIPIKLFEYLALGRPVVASRLEGVLPVLRDGENALLVPPGDSAALAAALVRLWRDRDLWQRLHLAGPETARRHRWNGVHEPLVARLNGLVRRRRAAAGSDRRPAVAVLGWNSLADTPNRAINQRLAHLAERFDVVLFMPADRTVPESLARRLMVRHAPSLPAPLRPRRWREPVRSPAAALERASSMLWLLCAVPRTAGLRDGFVYTTQSPAAVIAWLLRRRGFRWVADVLDMPDLFVEPVRSGELRGSWRGRLLEFAYARICRLDRIFAEADLVFTTAHAEDRGFARRLLAEFGIRRERLRLVSNGTDLAALPPVRYSAPSARFVIAYVGPVARSRDVHLLVDAMPRLAATVPGVELWLIGEVDPAYRAALERTAATLAAAHGRTVIHGHGFLPHAETLALLRQAHLCAYTCPRTPVRDGAQAIKVFEYLGMGLPVLASDLDGVRGIVRDGENGVLVEPASADAIVAAVQALAQQPERLVCMAARARTSVEPFDWRLVNGRFEQELCAWLARARRPSRAARGEATVAESKVAR